MKNWIIAAAVSFSLLLGSIPTHAAMREEYEVKAAFIYNFSKFIEWPTDVLPKAGEPFLIGVLGDNPFHGHLQMLERESVQGAPIIIREYRRAKEAKVCHILFISRSEEKRVDAILKELAGTQVLTVSDMDGFIKLGGMISFRMKDQKVQFMINRNAMLGAGLKPSSELLKLAKELIP
jgi:hypothetical protein